MSAGIVCGTWTGQCVRVDRLLHLGSWVPVNGMWGECRTDCGIDDLGYLTGTSNVDNLCPKCFEEPNENAGRPPSK